MTQDYKDILLRYLTGNLNEETGDNTPQFNVPITKVNSLGNYITTNAGLLPEIIDIIQGYQSNYSIIYGNKNNNKGFMVIIDENYNPVQYIDSYSSGTLFGTFKLLNVDDEGFIYGIDETTQPRFIMLNNITLKKPNQSEFIVRLRQSYFLPSPLSSASHYYAITKGVGQAKYLIGATTTSGGVDSPLVTELTINVGATNDWVDYDYEESKSFIGQTLWASWNEDNLSFKFGGYIADTNLYYTEYYLDTVVQKKLIQIPTPDGYSNDYYEINSIISNSNTTYVGVFDAGIGGYDDNFKIYKINYTNNSATEIDSITGSKSQATVQPNRIKFRVTNGNVFVFMKQLLTDKINLYNGIIVNEDISRTTIEINNLNYIEFVFYVSNIYNLYNYNIVNFDNEQTNTHYLIQQVYNLANYNGIAYENINALVPNSAILYDINDIIIFARNLYNKSVYGNTTLSVLQIPNIMVNDITIDTQNLYGETNKILNNNTTNITKNIYETLYLNFYNTLFMQNRNTAIYITNQDGSNRINQSVSMATDYSNAKATKYRINYLNGTNEIKSITPTITNGIATYSFLVYVPSNTLILSVDIISEDTYTIYQTISGLTSLDANKIYRITQECYVE